MLDEMFRRNASYIWNKKTQVLSYSFFILCNFNFPPKKCPGVCIDQDIYYGKNKVAQNEKRKKSTWVFLYIKYGKGEQNFCFLTFLKVTDLSS